jgi:hypothetical protein
MNSTGVVFEDGITRTTTVHQPFYATGYPISEAYWARVRWPATIGCPDAVLRAALHDLHPGNSPGFETEAGNVGQHYYAWRYTQSGGDVVVNELLFWREGEHAWIELFNASDGPVDLTGWVVTNVDKSRSATLPDWVAPKDLPARCLRRGQNPTSFRDGAAWYTGSSTRFFEVAGDGVALFHAAGPVDRRAGVPRVTDASTIVDYVSWSYGVAAPDGPAEQAALDAGSGCRIRSSRRARLRTGRTHIVAQGETLGRDDSETDTNSPADWSALGGRMHSGQSR